MTLATQCLDRLVEMAHPNGGWAYSPGGRPQVEPTCLALLALAVDRPGRRQPFDAGLQCLAGWQEADGSFRIREGRDEAVWPTALALFTLAHLEGGKEARDRAAGWLLAVRGKAVEESDEFTREEFDIDPQIAGWSWTEGTFSWTEPTVWACLALARQGYAEHERVKAGIQMLLDRAFDEGGINCGNRKVFGRMTDPVPANTAQMLLAMAGGPDHPRLQAARAYLHRVLSDYQDLENLCWIRLALDAWSDRDAAAGQTSDALEERLVEAHAARHQIGVFADSPVREALTALALSVRQGNSFRFSREGSPAAAPSSLPPREKRLPMTERIGRVIRGWGVRALGHLRPVAATTDIHVARAMSYAGDLAAVVRDQYAHFRQRVPLAGKRVVLKPNLVEFHRDKVINTNPAVVAAAIELCRREGAAEVVVAEGPGHWRNTEYLVAASGLGDVLRHYQVPFIDLNHDNPVKRPNLGRCTRLEYLYLTETIATADVVISIPKMKTHHWAGVTLSLKNLFGTLPGICYGWPKNELHWQGIDNSIVDIALTRTPDLAIVDGIVAMEGDGPLNGSPVEMGVLVMGSDLLAVDATCCRLMQLDPEQVGHLQLGSRRRLGLVREESIRQLGEPIEPLSKPFDTLPRFHFLHRRRTPPGQVPA